MQYQIKLNQKKINPNINISVINYRSDYTKKKPNVYNQFFPYIQSNIFLLEPYSYLKDINNKSISYFIIIEIINKYNIKNPSMMFSNSLIYITSLNEMFQNIDLITQNKLCSYKKYIIHDYNGFIDNYKKRHATIIIHYDNYKTFLINIFIALIIQNNKGTLIFNIPTTGSDFFLNIIYFLMSYYTITMVKPFATVMHSNERYVICKNYNKDTTPTFLKYIKKNIDIINTLKHPYLHVNKPYYYLKLIEEEDTIWQTYILNILSKILINNDIKYTNEQNKIIIKRWYCENIR
jgi:hypothetical protein